MKAWDGFTVDRAGLILCAVMYAGIWVQLTLMHWAGGFKKVAMWGPVLATPLFVAAAAVGAVDREGILGTAMAVVLALGIVEGLVGVVLHTRGIVGQLGAFAPPPFARLGQGVPGAVDHMLAGAENDHTMGGCRMGTDRNNSVVNADLRCHDHSNLYICDASVFVTPGGAQPSQTIQALATRLADHLATAA